jgi:hypothetical protein
VLSQDCNGMALDGGAIRRDHDLALGAELVADPPQPDIPDVEDARHAAKGGLSMINEGGIDGIHEPPEDLTGSLAQHGQDGDRNDQADYRIRPLPSEGYSAYSQQHGQRRETVGASVQSVRDKSGRADAPANADAITGNQLVSGEPDDGRDRDSDQVRDSVRASQP